MQEVFLRLQTKPDHHKKGLPVKAGQTDYFKFKLISSPGALRLQDFAQLHPRFM